MIKTSRSRLEIRQEPNAAATVAGVALACFGMAEALFNLGSIAVSYTLAREGPVLIPLIRGVLGLLFMGSGWLFLRGRSRVVFDLDHRMVARYLGVGGRAPGGNRTWGLEEFGAVVLVSREHRRTMGRSTSSLVVCLRR